MEIQEPRDRYFAADQAPFEVETRLTAIHMAVRPEGMISREVCPVVDSGGPVFSYTKEKTREQFALPDLRIGRASRATQIEVGATNTDDRVPDWGLEGVVPRRDRSVQRAQGAGRDPLARATETVASLVRLGEEKRVADMVFGVASYAAGYSETVAAGASRWDVSTGQPLNDIVKRADSMLLRPNVLVLGQQTWSRMRTQGQILEATKMTGAGKDQAAGLAKLEAVREELGLRRILVGEARADTARPGASVNYTRLWGNHAALLYIDPNLVDLETQGATFCFAATWMASEGVITYYERPRGAYGSDSVKLVEPRKEIVADSDLGYLWRTVVSTN